MRVLVACEESQRVCIAFRERGFEAYSCDIQDCSGGHPEWHIKGDVLPLLKEKWDLIIAHPPCTYLSNAGARFLYPKGVLNEARLRKGLQAKDFFMAFYYANCDRVAIENPIPSGVYMMPPYSQIIQPWMFGHPVQKKTCLWLRGLPPLMPTDVTEERQSSKIPGNWFNHGGKERQQNRAKTFPGIAKAMAEQWGDFLRSL
ncbi:MAG: DNA cytosine methyltransferase [Oscillospiraceae bacterium]|nr:DNA cytosine methyltransferase [Oscillospiraceae bacterium]